MQKILDFLKSARVFYFATVEGDKPKVRPFGFFMEFNGKLYFGMGTHKPSFKQISANPNIEVCALDANNSWIRLRGRIEIDSSAEALGAAFAASPNLKGMYNDETGMTMGLCYVAEGECEFCSMSGAPEIVKI